MKIIVDTEEEKNELIEQSKYVHDFVIRIRGKKGERGNCRYCRFGFQ